MKYQFTTPLEVTDAYKVSHRTQAPEETALVCSNFTARGSRVPGVKRVIFFGLQYFVKKYLIDEWNKNFFERDVEEVVESYTRRMESFLGPNHGGDKHVRDLHALGHLPLQIIALPEGSAVDLRVPMLMMWNTDPRFDWLTNYIETIMSNTLWLPCTSATTTALYRSLLDSWALKTNPEMIDFVPWQIHDFSMRGMPSMEASVLSGAAHLLSATGTDTIPAIGMLEQYYNADATTELIGGSVPASEHSVSSLGTAKQMREVPNIIDSSYPYYDYVARISDELGYPKPIAVKNVKEPTTLTEKQKLRLGELLMFKRLITEVFPTGIFSAVMDTFHFWNVIDPDGGILRTLRDVIMSREGKVVIRPDCYDSDTSILTPRGWVNFTNLRDDDLVAQVHPDNTYTFVSPTRRTRMDYNGWMVEFKDHHGKCDLLVTPNHRMLWYRRKGGDRVCEAAGSSVGTWENKMYRSAAAPDYDRSLTPLDRFRIAFQADGSYPSNEGETAVSGQRCYRFNFAKTRKIDRLRSICEEGEFRHRFTNEPAREGQTTCYVWLPSSEVVTKDFSWVTTSDLCGNWCREFVEEVSYWDSSRRSEDRFKFDTINPEVVKTLELVALSAGYGVLWSTTEDTRSPAFSDVHTLHIMKDNMIGSQSIEKNYKWYAGEIHCVTVPTGMLLVKRNRGTAVCGNSGDPVKVVTGYFPEEVLIEGDRVWLAVPNTSPFNPTGGLVKGREICQAEYRGLIQCLHDIFGGTKSSTGYVQLDPHIGAIYGDSITRKRAQEICERLERKGFASTNLVYGVGSFTYCGEVAPGAIVTRDTYGFAIKATYAELFEDGKVVPLNIFKDPVTDDGLKKSAKGLIAVTEKVGGGFEMKDEATWQEVHDGAMETVFYNGEIRREQSLKDIRKLVGSSSVSG